jgi:hypothetical protein
VVTPSQVLTLPAVEGMELLHVAGVHVGSEPDNDPEAKHV